MTVHIQSVSRGTTFLKWQMRGCGSGLWSPHLHFSSVQSDGTGVYPSMQRGRQDRLRVHHRVKRQTDAALHTDGRVSDHRELLRDEQEMKLKHFLLRLTVLRIMHYTPCPDAGCALCWIKFMEFISRENYKKSELQKFRRTCERISCPCLYW